MSISKSFYYLELSLRRLKRRVSYGHPQAKSFREYLNYLPKTAADYPTGTVNITVDFELACGRSKATSLDVEMKRGRVARDVFEEFVHLSEVYAIPITFAVTGHLFLDSCEEGSHYLPPPSAYGRKECPQHLWSNRHENPYTYAPDLIERILNSKNVVHEIASHGFLHVNFALCDEAIARNELEAFQRAAGKFGVVASTFIYPDNDLGHLHLLKEFGYRSYRHHTNGQIALDSLGLLRVPLGLWLSPFVATTDELEHMLELICRRKTFAHLWMHLAEFEYGSHQVTSFLTPLFRAINSARERGALISQTIAGFDKVWRTKHQNELA